jgi:hypothetical protein
MENCHKVHGRGRQYESVGPRYASVHGAGGVRGTVRVLEVTARRRGDRGVPARAQPHRRPGRLRSLQGATPAGASKAGWRAALAATQQREEREGQGYRVAVPSASGRLPNGRGCVGGHQQPARSSLPGRTALRGMPRWRCDQVGCGAQPPDLRRARRGK